MRGVDELWDGRRSLELRDASSLQDLLYGVSVLNKGDNSPAYAEGSGEVFDIFDLQLRNSKGSIS